MGTISTEPGHNLVAIKRSPEDWESILKDFDDSGTSLASFCAERGTGNDAFVPILAIAIDHHAKVNRQSCAVGGATHEAIDREPLRVTPKGIGGVPAAFRHGRDHVPVTPENAAGCTGQRDLRSGLGLIEFKACGPDCCVNDRISTEASTMQGR